MVIAAMNYVAAMTARPRYHANDASRDVLELDPRDLSITDMRARGASLLVEGFALVDHVSAVRDFGDAAQVRAIHCDEIAALVKRLSGADAAVVTSPGVLRFAEKSGKAGSLSNSRPARFIHVDINDATAADFARRAAPEGRTVRRFAHYNVWRAVSGPPQDVPLAVCDARSVTAADLVEADAVFDEPGKPEWSFVGLVIRHNPAHCWHYFRDMTPGEVLVFKTNDSDPDAPHCVPHSAFDDPGCPAGAPARTSIEMRAIAYWFD